MIFIRFDGYVCVGTAETNLKPGANGNGQISIHHIGVEFPRRVQVANAERVIALITQEHGKVLHDAAGEFARAHGEVFQGIDPVSSGVQAGLTLPGMMIEIEVDALIHDRDGNIDYGVGDANR